MSRCARSRLRVLCGVMLEHSLDIRYGHFKRLEDRQAMTLEELQRIVAVGESETVEFKRSTGQLSRAAETICAFLNGQGGCVFLGISPEGKIAGQQISDGTLREVAAVLSRLEPAVYRPEFFGQSGSHKASGKKRNVKRPVELGLCPRPRDF